LSLHIGFVKSNKRFCGARRLLEELLVALLPLVLERVKVFKDALGR
jgi:hypothetical protein